MYVTAYDGRIHAVSAKFGTARYAFVTAALAQGGAQGGTHRLATGAAMFSSLAMDSSGAHPRQRCPGCAAGP